MHPRLRPGCGRRVPDRLPHPQHQAGGVRTKGEPVISALQKRIARHAPSRAAGSPDVWGIYEPDSGSIPYICADPATKKTALIDVVRNCDPNHYRTETGGMEQVLEIVARQGLTIEWVLHAHPHADHPVASARLTERTGAPNATGEKGRDIARFRSGTCNMPDAFAHDGADRDERIRIRQERDQTRALPDRMLAALQVNLRGGRLPTAENDGRHYLNLPMNRF